jgi:hypothetical protein
MAGWGGITAKVECLAVEARGGLAFVGTAEIQRARIEPPPHNEVVEKLHCRFSDREVAPISQP